MQTSVIKVLGLSKVRLVLILVMTPGVSLAWTTTIDCEGGTLNQLPSNTGITYWGNRTIYSNEQVASGSQSCKFTVMQDSEGWPSTGGPLEWGAIFTLPTTVGIGKELWVRLSLFVPNDFQIVSNSGMLKFIRLHTRTSTANTGCLDLFLGDPTIPLWDPTLKKDVYPPMIINFEGVPGLTMVGVRPNDNPQRGRWETYEIYAKVTTSTGSNDAISKVRVWKNNQLIIDSRTQISAVDATGIIDTVYLFTYWNGNSPTTQSLYMDDFIMTNETPSARDAQGFPFIGLSIPRASPPKAPSGLVVR